MPHYPDPSRSIRWNIPERETQTEEQSYKRPPSSICEWGDFASFYRLFVSDGASSVMWLLPSGIYLKEQKCCSSLQRKHMICWPFSPLLFVNASCNLGLSFAHWSLILLIVFIYGPQQPPTLGSHRMAAHFVVCGREKHSLLRIKLTSPHKFVS